MAGGPTSSVGLGMCDGCIIIPWQHQRLTSFGCFIRRRIQHRALGFWVGGEGLEVGKGLEVGSQQREACLKKWGVFNLGMKEGPYNSLSFHSSCRDLHQDFLFFPTCQVRVVRFYVSLFSSCTPVLLYSSFLSSSSCRPPPRRISTAIL